MNRDDIIRMAREAGIRIASASDVVDEKNVYAHELERFVALVAAAERDSKRDSMEGIHTCSQYCQRPACVETRKAVAAEREACARLMEQVQLSNAEDEETEKAVYGLFLKAAAAIRARGEK